MVIPVSSVPVRSTGTSFQYSNRMGTQLRHIGIAEMFNHDGLYRRSLTEGVRVTPEQLRNFSRMIPAQRAISIIANGVLNMPWTITPLQAGNDDTPLDDEVKGEIKCIQTAFKRPNYETETTYPAMIWSLVTDMTTLGYACVERQPGDGDHPFWWWAVDSARIYANPEWYPGSGVYRWEERDRFGILQKEIDDENLFLIKLRSSSFEMIPPSPLEIAYEALEGWLGISRWQNSTTANAVREYMVCIEDCQSQAELDRVRDYFKSNVGTGEVPVIGGRVTVQKMGARNDEELYPGHADYLLRLVALGFNLTSQDMGLVPHDNRATAEVAYTSTFQYAVKPVAVLIETSENVELLDYYCDGYVKEFVDTEPTNQKEEAEVAEKLYAANLATRNEARKRMGLPSIGKHGDKFADGVTLEESDQEEADQKKAMVAPRTAEGIAQQNQNQENGKVALPAGDTSNGNGKAADKKAVTTGNTSNGNGKVAVPAGNSSNGNDKKPTKS